MGLHFQSFSRSWGAVFPKEGAVQFKDPGTKLVGEELPSGAQAQHRCLSSVSRACSPPSQAELPV